MDSSGSVVVDYVLIFADPTTPVAVSDVTDKLQTAAANDDFGDFTVDSTSIVHEGTVKRHTNTVKFRYKDHPK